MCQVSLRAGMCSPGELSDRTHSMSPTQKGERTHETRVRRTTLTTCYTDTSGNSHSFIHSEGTLSTRGTRTHKCHLDHHTHGCTAVSFQTCCSAPFPLLLRALRVVPCFRSRYVHGTRSAVRVPSVSYYEGGETRSLPWGMYWYGHITTSTSSLPSTFSPSLSLPACLIFLVGARKQQTHFLIRCRLTLRLHSLFSLNIILFLHEPGASAA